MHQQGREWGVLWAWMGCKQRTLPPHTCALWPRPASQGPVQQEQLPATRTCLHVAALGGQAQEGWTPGAAPPVGVKHRGRGGVSPCCCCCCCLAWSAWVVS